MSIQTQKDNMHSNRWASMGLIVGVLACWPGSAQAVTLIPESNFEGSGPAADGWNYIQSYCTSSPCPYLDVSTEKAHAGSKSLKLTYNKAWSDPNPQINTVGISRQFPAGTWKDVYLRYWHYTPLSFRYNTPSTKKIVMLNASVAGSGDPRFISVHWYGNRELGYINEYPPTGVQSRYDRNMGVKPLIDATWQCVEEHIKYNTPGVADGVLEMWVDGVQTLGYYNQLFQSSGHNGRHIGAQVYKQNGWGTLTKAAAGYTGSGPDGDYGVIYIDQFVAATTRIGCGIAGGDTTPPATPSNFIVSQVFEWISSAWIMASDWFSAREAHAQAHDNSLRRN